MAAHQALPSLGFSRQEHWSGLPFPSPMHEREKWKWSHSVVSDSCDPMDCSLPGSSVHGFSRQECWSGVSLPSLVGVWARWKARRDLEVTQAGDQVLRIDKVWEVVPCRQNSESRKSESEQVTWAGGSLCFMVEVGRRRSLLAGGWVLVKIKKKSGGSHLRPLRRQNQFL